MKKVTEQELQELGFKYSKSEYYDKIMINNYSNKLFENMILEIRLNINRIVLKIDGSYVSGHKPLTRDNLNMFINFVNGQLK